MPPKTKFSQDDILKAAFKIAGEQGLLNLSARTIAEELGCSTSPIYSLFKSMEMIEEGVCKLSTELLIEYQTTPYTGSPFMDMGLGYIIFAKMKKKIFRDMFMNTDSLKPYSREMVKYANTELMVKVMDVDPTIAGLSDSQKEELLQTMWFFAHGVATQMNINAFPDKSDEEILNLLKNIIDPIIEKMKNH